MECPRFTTGIRSRFAVATPQAQPGPTQLTPPCRMHVCGLLSTSRRAASALARHMFGRVHFSVVTLLFLSQHSSPQISPLLQPTAFTPSRWVSKNPALPEILSIATSALPHSLPSLSPRALKSCCTCCSADAPDTVPLPCAPSRLASSAENRRTPALAQRPAAPAAALGRYGGRNVRWQKP